MTNILTKTSLNSTTSSKLIGQAIQEIRQFEGHGDKTFIAAMSGGVDSAVAGALYHLAGYNVIGITLQLYKPSKFSKGVKSCCGGLDINDAAIASKQIGIKHYVLNYQDIFKKRVIDNFVQAYLNGETPNPCITCNDKIKFTDLLKTAKQMKADGLITGHYLINRSDQDQIAVYVAKDHTKDQSYFLYNTKKEVFPYLRFPLGNYHKSITRQMAKDLNLFLSNKPESQDICFVGDGKYTSLISKRIKSRNKKTGENLKRDSGLILNKKGQRLGYHDGVHNFTIGQRKGIKLGGTNDATKPLYVLAIDAKKNNIIVGCYDDLLVAGLKLDKVNWLSKKIPVSKNIKIEVKFRSNMKKIDAELFFEEKQEKGKQGSYVDLPTSTDPCRVIFKTKQHGIAKGQACVFYQGDQVLGGGVILEQIE